MSEKASKLNKTQAKYVEDIIKDISLGITSIEQTMASSLVPIHNFAEVVKDLNDKGRKDDIIKLARIIDTIKADLDIYGKEYKSYKTRVNNLEKSKPTRPRHIDSFVVKALGLGQELIEMNSRMLSTTAVMVEEYGIILGE